jgi:flagellar basal-body rod protein FlgF
MRVRRAPGGIRRESDESSVPPLFLISRIAMKLLEKIARTVWRSACIQAGHSRMDQTAVTAASGLRARMEALDMLSNNLANAATSGYKLDREFYTLFTGAEDDSADGSDSIKLPQIQKQWTDFSQGTLQPTGSPLDLALSGKGFFSVTGPSGPLYTRNGAFKLSQSGVLTTTEGYPVNTTTGGTIQTASQNPLTVSSDGTVVQDGQPLGQIAVMDFTDRAVLQKMGTSYFTNGNSAAQPAPADSVTVEQGKIEASNVNASESAVQLVGVMRQFEMLQKAISVTTDMDKKALDEVARVGSGL